MNRVLIAGTASGVGKTTVSLGMMAALSNRNKKVAPFKVGPDYIDPSFHKYVTGNPSHNLDSWLLDTSVMEYLFRKNMENMDIGVIEGVMGLYDGFGTEKNQGSSAHVAKITKTPVILVVDGSKMASSGAAMVLGYKLYDTDVPIKGVIINKVSGQSHYNLLKTVIERDVEIPCLGYLPSNLGVSMDSRHLGLIPAEEIDNLKDKIDKLVEMIEKYIDVDKIVDIAKKAEDIENIENPMEHLKNIGKGIKIGVARDKAFSFYYQDCLNLMEYMGMELHYFSPLNDKDIPKDVDGIYIGGGFPEIFGKELESNKGFRVNLKRHLENGVHAYGECGGLMYLTESIEDLEGNSFEMVDFIPTKSKMTKRLQRFGYVDVTMKNGLHIKGHEFHRSFIEDNKELEYIYDVRKIRNDKVQKEWKCGVKKKNAIVGYAHIHFYSNPELLIHFIDQIKKVKEVKKVKGDNSITNNG